MTTAPGTGITALMQSIVDYAGLFPPAKLDMDAAVRNYAEYVAGPDAWMLERLVVPVARLEEFETSAAALLPTGEDHEPWPISALAAPIAEGRLEPDLAAIGAFNERHRDPAAGLAVADSIEFRAVTAEEIDGALDLIPPEIFPFVEFPVATDPRGQIAALVGGEAGAKVRTGGMTADAYPSPRDVARFIAACATADVPFKATAGLHHPLRHFSEAVGTKELGFLNVFAAAALACHRGLDEAEILAVLEEESIDAFVFDASGLAWRTRRLTAEEIEDARLTFAVSFGCCSFDDPRNDLRALGLL